MNELSKIKLGKRLTAIEQLVQGGYDHIWDCCCDHGLLGLQLLASGKAKKLHFVDIVPQLLEEIEGKLHRFYPADKLWQVHCLDVATLPLPDEPNAKHLIIIVGVGGELLVELLSKLLPLTKTLNVDFIVSPVHHNYLLRTFLRDHHVGLIDELIIAENKRFYEVLFINDRASIPVSLVGDKMWNFNNIEHQRYLQETISHYQRMAKNPHVDVTTIIRAYQRLSLLFA
ncbi:MAG: tRNA (adenine(22)-N(1))-methyltransferase TrmK [Psychromonas sp.]